MYEGTVCTRTIVLLIEGINHYLRYSVVHESSTEGIVVCVVVTHLSPDNPEPLSEYFVLDLSFWTLALRFGRPPGSL